MHGITLPCVPCPESPIAVPMAIPFALRPEAPFIMYHAQSFPSMGFHFLFPCICRCKTTGKADSLGLILTTPSSPRVTSHHFPILCTCLCSDLFLGASPYQLGQLSQTLLYPHLLMVSWLRLQNSISSSQRICCRCYKRSNRWHTCVCKLNQLQIENIYGQRQCAHVYDCLNNANINHLQSLNCIQFYESPRDYLNRVRGCT